MTDQPRKRISIDAPDAATILAARHLDATEGRVQIGAAVDSTTRSAINQVLRYVSTAHNSPAVLVLPASTAPTAAAHPLIQGSCPACNGSSLFLGTGGYVTCSRLDCPNPTAADDQLHRGRPDPRLRDHVAAALIARIKRATISKTQPYDGLTSLLAANEFDLADTAIEALVQHLAIGDAEAWCKTCRRVWDGKDHQCQSGVEQRLANARAAAVLHRQGLISDRELYAAIEAAPNFAEQPARTTPNNPTTSKDQ